MRAERTDDSTSHVSADELVRLLVNNVQDYAMFVLDTEGCVATWNLGAERIKGYRADEVIGSSFERFFNPEDVDAGKPALALQTAKSEGRFIDEGWRVRKDGSRFWASVVLTALRDQGGRLLGFAKVTRDLSARRELELEQLRVAQAREAIRLRDEFLSIASHELRTPLTALLLQLESLSEDAYRFEPVLARKLERSLRSGRRLSELVETLLDVSRIATGGLQLTYESVEIVSLVLEVVGRFEAVAERAGTRIAVDAQTAIHGSWDSLRVEQIVSNLVGNALHHGAGALVEVRVALDGDEVVIAVADRGHGIADVDKERVFLRFERAASAQNVGGLGLGLFLVRQIAAAHGGTVTAKDREGGGAVLELRLPVRPTGAKS
ncbi:MAG: PAS domain-containing sensor histidine kinase [Polyangiales bacterium]|nr:PAS domain S-box protein [Myxococcales bacterium]